MSNESFAAPSVDPVDLPSPAEEAPGPRAAPARRRPLSAAWASLRPQQWAKNVLLLVPLVFSFEFREGANLLRAGLALLAFCLLASAVYLLNDVADRSADQLHPMKRLRPIAAGELSVSAALALALALAAGAGALAVALGEGFAACAAAYTGLQFLYSFALKRMVVVDVFAIAAGFVLRVVAGAAAIGVPTSRWLFLCTLLLSLFLAVQKRRAELESLRHDAERHRPILAQYSVRLLDQFAAIAAGGAFLAYALYSLAPETVARFGHERMGLTIVPVLFGLCRYLYLVHERGQGGAPERVLFRDRPLQVSVAVYAALVAWAVLTAPHR